MSAYLLKLIASLAMLSDHIGYLLTEMGPEYQSAAAVLRMIGRVAFPIYCFLLVEGFSKTKNVYKYELRIAILAVISELPFNLCFFGQILYSREQNVFITLMLSLACMWCVNRLETVERIAKNNLLLWSMHIAVPAVFCILAVLVRCDYSYKGILYVMVFYYLRFDKLFMLVEQAMAQLLFSQSCISVFALVPIAFYNGKRSNLEKLCQKSMLSQVTKWGFYLFYPLHLIILWVIAKRLGIW